ncbi:hypothetical protein GOB85_09890 [Acetobacter sp. LMG 1636]|uniref:Outer membrane protein beta-barrel domain-containing protein n=2 Tax=Acetobacter fallax TaxID=1737473 RepID=A0ABX0KAK1_9PROT|nr:hypothetical protein [Acetobacter fallax]NHO32798.1 hypothetical protein [Acetobacter fallax]NHO36418.1 hypothetical protein [Acetobacter fallax]
MPALVAGGKAHAQFAPSHTTEYLDTRREDELRHRTLARMLMTLGMDPTDNAPVVTGTSTTFNMPVRPFEPQPRKPRKFAPDNYDAHRYTPSPRRLPAVVQVNREIGIAAAGIWSNYKEKPLHDPAGTGYDRETGWTTGFQVDASTMFDLYEVGNIFIALHFAYGDGSTGYHGSASSPTEPGLISPYNTSSQRMTTDSRLELGKGIMVSDRFLITPALQGGYRTWNRHIDGSDEVSSLSEDYGTFLAGIVVRLDYALTRDFVLRGRLGWAELVGTRMDARDVNGTFHLRNRPEWDAALDFDYRVSGGLHLTGGVQYTYFSFGRSQAVAQYGGYSLYEPSSWTNGVTMHAGVAYGF